MSDDPVARSRSMVIKDVTTNFSRPLTGTYGGSCVKDPPVQPLPNQTGRLFHQYHGVTMQDFVTPRFKKQSAEGRIINTAMTKVDTIREWFPGTCDYRFELEMYGCTPAKWYDTQSRQDVGAIDSFLWFQQRLGTNPYLAEPVLSANQQLALRELAITDAYANIGNSDVMALVALAESEKSMDGLISTFKRVAKILGKLALGLKRLNVQQVRTQSNKLWLDKRLRKDLMWFGAQAPQLYMEARYGLRPLYYDILGFMKFYNKPKKLSKDRLTFRGWQWWEQEASDIRVIRLPYFGWYFYVDVSLHRHSRISHEVRAGVLTSFKEYNHIQGLGIDLLAETAWELVPFSFIVDWFLNVGKLIASWTPNIGFRPLTSWVTLETTVTKSVMTGGSTITPVVSSTTRAKNIVAEFNAAILDTKITRQRIPKPNKPFSLNVNVKLDKLKLLDLAIILSQMTNVSTLIKKFRV